jgi:hypothetical protein
VGAGAGAAQLAAAQRLALRCGKEAVPQSRRVPAVRCKRSICLGLRVYVQAPSHATVSSQLRAHSSSFSGGSPHGSSIFCAGPQTGQCVSVSTLGALLQ